MIINQFLVKKSELGMKKFIFGADHVTVPYTCHKFIHVFPINLNGNLFRYLLYTGPHLPGLALDPEEDHRLDHHTKKDVIPEILHQRKFSDHVVGRLHHRQNKNMEGVDHVHIHRQVEGPEPPIEATTIVRRKLIAIHLQSTIRSQKSLNRCRLM